MLLEKCWGPNPGGEVSRQPPLLSGRGLEGTGLRGFGFQGFKLFGFRVGFEDFCNVLDDFV